MQSPDRAIVHGSTRITTNRRNQRNSLNGSSSLIGMLSIWLVLLGALLQSEMIYRKVDDGFQRQLSYQVEIQVRSSEWDANRSIIQFSSHKV
ncbi:hypothetical protein [Gordonia jacobaea]|uniref:hypothetical protein n=1 Tax=Gordonia jacobaea TaxID=122202 RepID=UPI003D74A5F1